MTELLACVNDVLNHDEEHQHIAENILAEARDVLYMGRGSSSRSRWKGR